MSFGDFGSEGLSICACDQKNIHVILTTTDREFILKYMIKYMMNRFQFEEVHSLNIHRSQEWLFLLLAKPNTMIVSFR